MNNTFVKNYIKKNYGFDIECASFEELASVNEILINDVTGFDNQDYDWDFSSFSNLRKLNCGYNYIKKLNVSQNSLLEYLNWAGTRCKFEISPDISKNSKLKTLVAGQDSIIELDLSNNPQLEDLTIYTSFDLRWLDISKCIHLKSIYMEGVNIPFVDLTTCKELRYVNINYMNLYRNCENKYGKGYPRPILFVDENFDESVINKNTREYSYYTYYIVRVTNNSPEEHFLNELKKNKEKIIAIPSDCYGRYVAMKHYEIIDNLCHFRNQQRI